MKYEYLIKKFNNLPVLGNGNEMESELNRLGLEGWECYCVEWSQPVTLNFLFFSTSKLHKERIFYFKRPIYSSEKRFTNWQA